MELFHAATAPLSGITGLLHRNLRHEANMSRSLIDRRFLDVILTAVPGISTGH
ncbi:hypothetical protein [Planotetraspora kaengkrachanensis]|uniref:hypothetical protein n=1 Tax=Planotetraspora kaengkrachanensis TaxID=575193 RepID=UPI001943385F|nr:hypothetical protein [Planotetraspora kaengkrachanensis]